jgi:pSer/pThr/pTyr-binding forkhead associated (FHA) protein
MAAPSLPSAGMFLVVHLLDSAQGNSLQTWRFSNQEIVTIGRDTNNDIIISDQQVSRAHAKLTYQNGVWTLVSTGRHGTLVNDRLVSDIVLQPHTVFRLGASGPMLRFDDNVPQTRRTETLDNLDFDLLASLAIDEQRKQAEVDQIAENALFRDLQERSKRLRSPDSDVSGAS